MFEYHASFPAEETPNCAVCCTNVRSALFIPRLVAECLDIIEAYICDDCLLKLFNAVPLLSWAMRETMLQEAVAVLEAAD